MSKIISCAQHEAPALIRDGVPFNAHALTARIVDGLGAWDSGRLSGDDLAEFRRDPDKITYVVYSYSTPIYWRRSDGTSYKVLGRFSRTTSSKHQSRLYLV